MTTALTAILDPVTRTTPKITRPYSYSTTLSRRYSTAVIICTLLHACTYIYVTLCLLLCTLLPAVTLKNCAFPAQCIYMFCMIQKAAAVYLYGLNYLFFMMKIQCVFCGAPTDLRSINKRYRGQKALPRHPTIYLVHFKLAGGR